MNSEDPPLPPTTTTTTPTTTTTTTKPASLETPQPKTPAASEDVEAQTPPSGGTSSLGSVSSIVNRWKREDLLKKGSLVLRTAALLFSLLSLIVTGSNKHGDWKDFENYEEYRYLLAVAILTFLYTGAQIILQVHQFSTGTTYSSNFLDFFGDQILSYLLISSASSAVPVTNMMRNALDNSFTDSSDNSFTDSSDTDSSDNSFIDSSAAAISMSFFAFLVLALSSIVSGFRLSNQKYI